MKTIFQKIFIICGVISICFSQCKCGHDKQPVTTVKDSVNVIPPIVTQLQKQINKNPDSADLRLRYATLLDSVGLYKEAVLQLDTLTFKDKNNYNLWFTKGRIFEANNDSLRALKCYIKAHDIYPSVDAKLAIANLYAEQKNERALLICNEIQKLRMGRDYDAHCAFICGVYNSRTGNKQAAIKFFDKCISYKYTYMEAYIEKGLIFFDDQKYNEALKIFEFGSSINNLYPDCYYYMGRAYQMMNKKDSAIIRFEQALSLDPKLTEAKEQITKLTSIKN